MEWAERWCGVDNRGKPSGGQDTFIVSVQFQQNATWQGTIKWAGQNEEQRFRSTLEMLKIMDGALAAGRQEDTENEPQETKPE